MNFKWCSYGLTLQDHITNKTIEWMDTGTSVIDNKEAKSLTWYSHVQTMKETDGQRKYSPNTV